MSCGWFLLPELFTFSFGYQAPETVPGLLCWLFLLTWNTGHFFTPLDLSQAFSHCLTFSSSGQPAEDFLMLYGYFNVPYSPT